MNKIETCTGVFTRTTFTATKSPKWLTPINNFARLFGLTVMPIGNPMLLSKVIAEMTFKENEEKAKSG